MSDISVEALLNQSSDGLDSSKRLAVVPVNTVGAATHRSTPITANGTAQQITLTAGMRSIEIQNTGSSVIYYGGSGVTTANGLKLFPNQTKPFNNVKDTFSIYVITDGTSVELRVVEYA